MVISKRYLSLSVDSTKVTVIGFTVTFMLYGKEILIIYPVPTVISLVG